MEVIYKNHPMVKFPYYRATVYMDENYDDPDLAGWFEWFKSKKIPCCIAMGNSVTYFGRLAVWVWGEEAVVPGERGNDERMGRIVESYEGPKYYQDGQ